MTDPRALWKPLPIWHADGPLSVEHMARLRNVKLSLWLDYSVKPYVADEGDMERRVLAWGSPPPFVCSFALVDPLGTDAEMASALGWVLHEGESDIAMELPDVLSVALGGEVREISAEELAAEEKYAAYQEGRD